MVINNGFSKSDKVQNQLDEYEQENNPILAFINDTGVDMIENEPTADVYKRYQVFVQTMQCSQCQILYSVSRSIKGLGSE